MEETYIAYGQTKLITLPAACIHDGRDRAVPATPGVGPQRREHGAGGGEGCAPLHRGRGGGDGGEQRLRREEDEDGDEHGG